ncbi:MAG: hypothetical protein BWX84_01582 [Verrucomicrobia bacterium ADurb.Bin118]|nr:MAG: hypothetical protein BWX84_01582 [Verrucomicrobia bacterium ADurb.Bin118]
MAAATDAAFARRLMSPLISSHASFRSVSGDTAGPAGAAISGSDNPSSRAAARARLSACSRLIRSVD